MSRVAIAALVTSEPPPAPSPRLQLVEENGREYWHHLLHNLVYPFPHDDLEHDRLDQFYYMIHDEAMRALTRATITIPRGRLRALDIGHGTGIWLYEMRERYPDAWLVGIDIAPPPEEYPHAVHRDLRFLSPVDFRQREWPFAEGSFDLIHMEQLLGSVSDWEQLCSTALRYLAPGTGRLELIEFDFEPCCDDGTLSSDPNAPMNVWWRTMCDASNRIGKPIAYPHYITRLLEQIGFEVELSEFIRVESWQDIRRGDPHSKHLASIAEWYMMAMGSVPLHAIPEGEPPDIRAYSGLSMALFTRVAGWTQAEVERLQDAMYAPILRSDIHMYHRL